MADDRINKAIELSDKTGLGDTFSYMNQDEIMSRLPFSDPNDIPESLIPTSKPEKPQPQMRALTDREKEDKPIFEKMFGYNPESDMPWGYSKMTDFQRAAYRAHLGAQNLMTRVGLGMEHQMKGSLQLVLPESMEQYLTDDSKLNPDRLPEDKYYEKRIQKELNEKKSNETITPEESEHLDYLNETLPSGIQKLPEFIGRVDSEIVRIALSSEVLKMIPMPGGGNLSTKLTDAGKWMFGDALLNVSTKMAGKPLIKIGLEQLSKVIIDAGPNAASLFTWGFIAEETKEDENALLARTQAGIKMMPWALLPVLSVPAKMAGATKTGTYIKGIIQNAVTKVSVSIADKLAPLADAKAKKLFVNQALVEAEELTVKETGRGMSPVDFTQAKKIFTSLSDDASNLAKQSSDDIVTAIEKASGEALSKGTVSKESVIPSSLRVVENAGDDVINAGASVIERKTNYVLLKQPNGSYAILDKTNLHEVAVGIKRKNIAKSLEDLITNKKPIKNKLDVTKRSITKRTITEEVELKRVLRRMEIASNDGYRAGVKSANEKAAIKLTSAKERINTIRADNKTEWQNVEFARQLVKDFVPKEEQGVFLNRLLKAKSEGKLLNVVDDIEKHLNKKRVNLAIDDLRTSIKTLSSKYSDKSGRFAKAPDEVRPLLDSLAEINSSITKYEKTLTAEVDDLAMLANDLVTGINHSISGRGEVLGLSQNLVDDLYNLGLYKQGGVTAGDIETLANLAKVVIHRTEQAGKIKLNGVLVEAQEIVDDIIPRIEPKSTTKATEGLLGNVKQMVGEESDHPTTLLYKLFGRDSKALGLLDDIYEGQNTAYGITRDGYGILKSYLDENKLTFNSFKSLKKKVSITIGGNTYKVTRDDILGLAMSTRDPWVFDRLTTTRGVTIGGHKVSKLTTDELANAIAMLTDDEMKIGAGFFHLSNNYMSNVVNGTSLEINGVKLATYPQYYPSHGILDVKIYGNKYAMKTAETQSYFMPRIGGTGKMRINPFSRELTHYVDASAMYSGTAVPMRAMKTVMASKPLQDIIDRSGHQQEFANFMEIIGRSEGMYSDSSILDTIGQKFLGKFVKGILGGRVSTVLTQMGSIPAAKSMIPRQYFKASDLIFNRNTVDDLMNNSDMFWHRWTGNQINKEMGDIAASTKLQHFLFNKTPLTEKPMSGMRWGDKKAISAIHQAARRMIADTTTLVGNKAELAAIKMTENVTRLTQPNWNPLTRSKLSTDPGAFKSSLNVFRTAQEAQFNLAKRANITFQRSAKTASDLKELGTSYTAITESMATVTTSKLLWKLGRNTGIATVAGWLGFSVINDKKTSAPDVGKAFARTASSYVPMGSQIENLMEQGLTAAFGGKAYVNTSNDPISKMSEMGLKTSIILGTWTNKYIESISEKEREGFTVDLLSTSLDDILNEITKGEQDQEQAKKELWDKAVKDIATTATTIGLLVGAPVAPMDEWVAPALKQSPFAMVGKINHENSSNPVPLQRDLHKFLTLEKELKEKSDKKGLSQDEANLAFKIKIFKETYINLGFTLIDIQTDDSTQALDDLAESLIQFQKDNKKEIKDN